MSESAPYRVSVRMVAAAVCLLVVLAVLLYVLYGHQGAIAKHESRIRAAGAPVTVAELADSYVASDPDPTDLWVDAGRLFADRRTADAGGEFWVLHDPPKEHPDPFDRDWSDLALAERWIAGNDAGFAAIDEAAAMGGTVRFDIDLSLGVAALLPDTQNARAVSRALRLRTAVAAHRGDAAAVVADVDRMLVQSAALADEPLIVSQLVRYALFTVATDALDRSLTLVRPTPEQLARLQDRLAGIDFASGYRKAWEGERVLGRMMLRDTPAAAVGALGTVQRLVQRLLAPAATVRLYALHEDAERVRQAPPPQDRAGLAAISRAAKQDQAYGMVVGLLAPAFERFHLAMLRSVVRRDAMIVRLAAERFRAAHGRWPRGSDELLPEYLDRMPTDPYDGQPLRFRSGDDGVVVYSVFENGTDDGGKDVSLADRDVPADLGWRTGP